MFTEKDISNIDSQYFKILYTSPFAITIESEATTHHQWHLICKNDKNGLSCEVYHRHKTSDPWHRQWGGGRFPEILNMIKDHDKYQQAKDLARQQRISTRIEQRAEQS